MLDVLWGVVAISCCEPPKSPCGDTGDLEESCLTACLAASLRSCDSRECSSALLDSSSTPDSCAGCARVLPMPMSTPSPALAPLAPEAPVLDKLLAMLAMSPEGEAASASSSAPSMHEEPSIE